MIKKIICILFCIITLFSIFAFPGAAEDSADISTSDVMSDLKVMIIGGVKFSEVLYPKNPALTHVQILSFLEYGYDYSGDQSAYGIYVYVYNPSCKNIKKSNYNKIQIGAVRDESTTPIYRKYQLDEVSRSSDNRFIKYRLRDVKIPNSTNYLYDIVDSSRRIYKVSGIELVTDGQYQPTEYAISGTYAYTGYGKGYRRDKTAESTLYCKVEELLTIRLDLKSTVYRTQTSSLGIGHQNEVASVYFAIDDQILNTYGNLYAITAEWEEYKVDSIVTEFKDAVDQYGAYLGVPLTKLPGYTSGINCDFYSFAVDWDSQTTSSGAGDSFTYVSADVLMNKGSVDKVRDYEILTVPYMYYVNEISSNYADLDVTPNEILTNINLKGFYPLESVDEGRIKGYNRYHAVLGDTFSFLNDSYKSNHSWWDYVTENGLFGWSAIPEETYSDIEPIVKVTADDLRGSDSTVSQHLLVHQSNVDELLSYYNAQTVLNKSVFLFRFAATDYYQSGNGYFCNVTENGATDWYYDYPGYYARQTIYKDFDVIDLTFKDDYGTLTVIPAVSDPTDIIGGLGGAPDPSDKVTEAVGTSFGIILGILLVLALIFGVLWLVDYFYKLISGVSLYSKINSSLSKSKRRKRSRK